MLLLYEIRTMLPFSLLILNAEVASSNESPSLVCHVRRIYCTFFSGNVTSNIARQPRMSYKVKYYILVENYTIPHFIPILKSFAQLNFPDEWPIHWSLYVCRNVKYGTSGQILL